MSYNVEGMDKIVEYPHQVRILDEIDLLLDEYCLGEDYHITFTITNRLTKRAGNCTVDSSRFNKKITACRIAISAHYYRELGIDRIIGTLRHEIAHLIDRHMSGKLSHGANFRRICAKIGGTMNTSLAGKTYAASGTNEYLDKTARKFKYVYTCTCGSKIERKIRVKRGFRMNYNKICMKCSTPFPLWKETKVAI